MLVKVGVSGSEDGVLVKMGVSTSEDGSEY